MIEMKTYRMTLKRMMMTALMMLITVSAMSAEQKISLSITGKGKVEVTANKSPLTFTDNVATLTDAGGQTIMVSVKPDGGYTVTSVKAQLTIDAGQANTRTDIDASFIDVKKASDTEYTFEMPKDYNVRIYVTFESTRKDGEDDYSGVYYIANDNSGGAGSGSTETTAYSSATDAIRWFLVPADNPQQSDKRDAYYSPNHKDSNTPGDPEKPFLTTYQTNKDAATVPSGVTERAHNSVWIVKKTNDGYYNIIHAATGKYVIYEVPTPNTNNNHRKTMHLQVPDDENGTGIYRLSTNDNFKFTITLSDVIYRIQPKNRSGWYWNPANGNRYYYYGITTDKTITENTIFQSGLVGIYNNADDGGSKWRFVNTLLTAPTINFIQEGDNFTVTIADSNSLPAGYTILYTTNGDVPTIGGATTFTYPSAVTITENCTVKAVVARYGIILTEIATQYVGKPDVPTITPSNDCTNVIEMSAAEGVSIYYTLDGTSPDNNSTPYTEPFVLNEVATIKAIAYNGAIHSDITTHNFTSPYTVKPTITSNGATITITGTGSFYYTTDGTEPDTDSTPYTVPFTLSGSNGQVITVKAVAKDGSQGLSCVVEKSVIMARYISTLADLGEISSYPTDIYILTADIDASKLSASISGFTGEFDGAYHTISGLTKPLFTNLNGGTVKNVAFSGVDITSGDNVGAVCDEADGTTKIYNCGVLSGSVSGTNVGGLVGHIKSGSSVRVVNCFSYANVSGGTNAAGIVGYNEGTVGDVRIALCMMYGNLTGGKSPVYAGNHTSNNKNFTEYNYWLYSTTDANGKKVPKTFEYSVYNDQLAIEREEYLTRFPFYRHILNTHRKLAAYFLFGDYSDAHVAEIGHWTLKHGDGAPKYPVLEEFIFNTHRTTQDIENSLPNTSDDGKGKLLTQMGSSGYVTVNITINGSSYSKQLPITDMNLDQYDYTWGKIVLPFANEFTGWTRDYSKICTGWEITSIVGGTAGSYANYDMADRDNTAKDLYSNSNYIFAQGGNYIVPYGVKTINIKAHFANAFYLSDPSYEIGYDENFKNPTQVGGSVNNTYHGKNVYTDLATLVSALSETTNPHVQAIVLVGNFHYMILKDATTFLLDKAKAVTIMSTDEDNNQEPDYGWYMGDTYGRLEWPAIRFDFVPIIELGMSSRVNSTGIYPGIGIWRTNGWFEQTETCVSFRSQCEINSVDFAAKDDGKGNNRWIINSGYFTQIVRAKSGNCTNLSYIQIGGNAYVKELYPGSHTDQARTNTAVPINVTGGQVDECYMTGTKAGGKLSGPMIYFWCAGGKIGKFLGAYLEEPQTAGLKARVDHALVGRFFGGGTSTSARIKGDIDITINNSTVDFFCGGPEFGDMYNGKTVTTHATGTIFGEYYGAGFGGTSITYNREQQNNTVSLGDKTEFPLSFTSYYKYLAKSAAGYGIGTCYKFEYIYHSNGYQGVARFYTGYAQFSLATTGSITNVLNNCKIKVLPGTNSLTPKATTGYFYGAGCQGKVAGTVTSTLTNCEVQNSAFGGGYKAAANEVDVYPNGATGKPTYSTYYKETGIFSDFGEKDPISPSYTWEQGDDDHDLVAGTETNAGKLFTSKNITMTDLGNVTGAISITIDGGSVGGDVYGGGNESKSLDNTTVILKGNAVISGNVFGGGNKAEVQGSTTVNIQE